MRANATKKSLMAILMTTTATLPVGVKAADEIVVTATRRATSTLEVPYNITAVSGEQLDKSGIDDISELIRMVPGVTYNDTGPRQAGNNNTLVIRGLTAEAGSGAFEVPSIARATVSTYVGESPVYFNVKLTDLDRVEVLRGPQGTLYGAGSLGGTIRFIPNKPDPSAFDGKITGGVGFTKDSDEPSHHVDAMINIPLGDQFAFRASGGRERIGGFVDAIGLAERNPDGSFALANPGDVFGSPPLLNGIKKDSNDGEIAHLRAAARWTPSENFEFLLTYQYQNVQSNNFQGTDIDNGLNRTLTFNDLNGFDSELNLGSLEMNWNLGFATLTSATTYYDINVNSRTDQSDLFQELLAYYYAGFPRISTNSDFGSNEKTVSQEVRLASNKGELFDWLLGVFYTKQDIDFRQQQTMPGFNDFVVAAPPSSIAFYFFGGVAPLDAEETIFTDSRRNTFRDAAIFGEVTVRPTQKWQITGGARVFWQKITFDRMNFFPLFGVPVAESSDRKLGDSIFKVNTSYKLAESTNVYFTWSQGFRNGGVNAFDTSGSFFDETSVDLNFDGTPDFLFPGINSFDADKVNNFEAGVKGDVMDGRLRYSLAGFYIDWKHPQLRFTGFNSFVDGVINSTANAVSSGVEVELSGNLSGDLSYNLSYAYTDAKFSEDGFVYITPVSDGDHLPNNSRHSFAGSVDYSHQLFSQLEAVFHVDGSYRSKFNNGIVGSTDDHMLDGFGIVNSSISLNYNNFSFRVFGHNLTDSSGKSGVSFPQASSGYFNITRPRTIGLQFTWRYESGE